MAKTDIQKYTVQEKLNKMDLDLITVTPTVDSDNAGTSTAGDLLFHPIEIPYAVSVNGGSAILQSCSILIDEAGLTHPIDFVMTSTETALEEADGSSMETGDSVATGTNTLTELDDTLGNFSVSNNFDAGVVVIGSKQNIGLVCKAADDSRSLWIWGMQTASADYNQSKMIIKLGFVKD